MYDQVTYLYGVEQRETKKKKKKIGDDIFRLVKGVTEIFKYIKRSPLHHLSLLFHKDIVKKIFRFEKEV